jgi:hypothetical protein
MPLNRENGIESERHRLFLLQVFQAVMFFYQLSLGLYDSQRCAFTNMAPRERAFFRTIPPETLSDLRSVLREAVNTRSETNSTDNLNSK